MANSPSHLTFSVNWTVLMFFALLAMQSTTVHCLSCRVCLDACGSTLNPKRLAIEECPVGDRGCSFITKNQNGTLTLIGGGCTEYIRNSCVTLDFEVICVHSCKGDLCNENIDFRDTKLTNGSK